MRYTKQAKPDKRVSFKKDVLVIVNPQHGPNQRVSIFDLRRSRLTKNPSATTDYSLTTRSKIPYDGRESIGGAQRDSGEHSHCMTKPTEVRNTPLKSILKKRSSSLSQTESSLKTAGSEYDNRSALGLRSRAQTITSKTLDRAAPISNSVRDKSIFSRLQTLPLTPGQKTAGQQNATSSPDSLKRNCRVGFNTTTRNSTMQANYSAQSSRSPAAKHGIITIIRPLSGVAFDLAQTNRTRPEANIRPPIKASRDLNVVGIPVCISDLYPSLQKLQETVEKMAERTEKLYSDVVTHSSVTKGDGWACKRSSFRNNDRVERNRPSLLQRSYSSVSSSSEGYGKKRMGVNRSDCSPETYQNRRALAWQPVTVPYRFQQQTGVRFGSTRRASLTKMHTPPSRYY